MTVQHSDRGPSADERNADALMLVCEKLHDVMLDSGLGADLILDQRQRTITIRYE